MPRPVTEPSVTTPIAVEDRRGVVEVQASSVPEPPARVRVAAMPVSTPPMPVDGRADADRVGSRAGVDRQWRRRRCARSRCRRRCWSSSAVVPVWVRVDREGVGARAEVDRELLERRVGDAGAQAEAGEPRRGERAGVRGGVAGVVDREQVGAGERAGAGAAVDDQQRR